MGHDLRRPALSPRRPARLNDLTHWQRRRHHVPAVPRAARQNATSTAAQLFYAKIELRFFIGHLYVPDVSFAPHQ
ncbi:hypothetical protein CFB84_12825 [Burkholderia aenigmatica]|uniref:Uncharacterized protein n=1 Tax=Burkholderia aenigmatica TaxID=2015348 RepID=A0A228IYM8_9BURK|nr:hypothetical protein CFB84_12825 [Burkholderia aenigmatica]